MATSSSLGLAKDIAVDDVLTRIQALVGGERAGDRLAVLPGLVVSAGAVATPLTQELFRDDWGLDVHTSVVFALGYQAEPDLRYRAEGLMSVAAARLVVDLDTDAGMTYASERKLLRRGQGVLALYPWWPQWSEPSVRQRLPAYELAEDEPQLG